MIKNNALHIKSYFKNIFKNTKNKFKTFQVPKQIFVL